MARIVSVYASDRRPFVPVDMSLIRWLKISEALARLGHRVDMATNEPGVWGLLRRRAAPNLWRVPLRRARWARYDVVKTLFHVGFETLEAHGGAGHDFIIAKLGSVVGDRDLDGVYFRGEDRRRFFEIQRRIARRARYIAVLTEESRRLWRACHGERGAELLVPGAVDARLPPPGPSPYPAGEPVCVLAGNIYDERVQAEAHRTLIAKINRMGRLLSKRGVRLHLLGRGDTSRIDGRYVACHGAVPYERSWDYLRTADVGLVLALGPHANHNESTKIYHYLRVGLPTVCEAGFPNQGLVLRARLGSVVENGDLEGLADAVAECVERDWDPDPAVRLVLEEHTWDARARAYDGLIREAV